MPEYKVPYRWITEGMYYGEHNTPHEAEDAAEKEADVLYGDNLLTVHAAKPVAPQELPSNKLGKITLNFKTPDVLDHVLDEVEDSDLPDEDKDHKKDRILALCGKFIEYKEYIKIEFDLDAGTAAVKQRF